MDLIQYVLNFFLPLISITIILVCLPPYMIYKLFKYFTKLGSPPENLAGKVVIITGASSGIGEQIAYEYARRGARLSLAARREDRLRAVAAKSAELGSPEVIVVCVDVSKEEDCEKLVEHTVSHFGRLDHLVNNAGVLHVQLFEEYTDLSSLRSLMDINFWGSVYCTRFAISHLRKSKGRIVVISSTVTWLTLPRLIVYNASKAAQLLFFETLKAELGSDIGMTIITPGVVDSEMIDDHFWSQSNLEGLPAGSGVGCGRAIVESACRGDMYLTNPYWYIVVHWFKVLFPQFLIKFLHLALVKRPLTTSKKDS